MQGCSNLGFNLQSVQGVQHATLRAGSYIVAEAHVELLQGVAAGGLALAWHTPAELPCCA